MTITGVTVNLTVIATKNAMKNAMKNAAKILTTSITGIVIEFVMKIVDPTGTLSDVKTEKAATGIRDTTLIRIGIRIREINGLTIETTLLVATTIEEVVTKGEIHKDIPTIITV